MPVLVTAAHQPLARRIAARLLEEGGEVRAYGSGDTAALRAAGAFVASGDGDDEGRLEAALADVHTLIHVGGGVLTSPDRIVAHAEVAARAAANAGVRRVITLSLPGAGAAARDEIRRAKGRAEEVLTAVPAPTVVIRTGLLDTPVLRDALTTVGLDDEVLAGDVAPVRVEDVIEVVAAFDRARSRSSHGQLVVATPGPRWMTLADYVGRVGVHGRIGRRLPDPATSRRLADALAGPWRDDYPGIVDAWQFTGTVPGAPGAA